MFLAESIRRPRLSTGPATFSTLFFLPSTGPVCLCYSFHRGPDIRTRSHVTFVERESGGSQIGGGGAASSRLTIYKPIISSQILRRGASKPTRSLFLSFSLSKGIEPWSTERFDSVFVDGGYVALKSRGSRFVCTQGGDRAIFADSRTRVSIASSRCYSLKTFSSINDPRRFDH